MLLGAYRFRLTGTVLLGLFLPHQLHRCPIYSMVAQASSLLPVYFYPSICSSIQSLSTTHPHHHPLPSTTPYPSIHHPPLHSLYIYIRTSYPHQTYIHPSAHTPLGTLTKVLRPATGSEQYLTQDADRITESPCAAARILSYLLWGVWHLSVHAFVWRVRCFPP